MGSLNTGSGVRHISPGICLFCGLAVLQREILGMAHQLRYTLVLRSLKLGSLSIRPQVWLQPKYSFVFGSLNMGSRVVCTTSPAAFMSSCGQHASCQLHHASACARHVLTSQLTTATVYCSELHPKLAWMRTAVAGQCMHSTAFYVAYLLTASTAQIRSKVPCTL